MVTTVVVGKKKIFTHHVHYMTPRHALDIGKFRTISRGRPYAKKLVHWYIIIETINNFYR